MKSDKPKKITESLMPLRPDRATSSRWGLSLVLLIIALVVAGLSLYVNLKKQPSASNANTAVPADSVVFATPTAIPTGKATPTPITEWSKFSSQFFTLSFEYPADYDVHEVEGEIDISEKQYQKLEIGRDNAFFRLSRFAGNFSLKNEDVLREGETKTTITLDGQKFTAYTSVDKNSCEGSAVGQFTRIILTRSEITTQQYECGEGGTDYSQAIEHILSTFKFSK